MAWEDRSDRIDHGGPRLVWQQVYDDLAREITDGTLAPDIKLPSEDDLAELYGVARVTVRRAIKELVDQRFLTRVHGRGTYVTRPEDRAPQGPE